MSALDQHVDERRGSGLAYRVAVEGCVGRDEAPSRRVRSTRDSVHDLDAAVVDGDLEAALGTRLDHLVDDLLNFVLHVNRLCLAHVFSDEG